RSPPDGRDPGGGAAASCAARGSARARSLRGAGARGRGAVRGGEEEVPDADPPVPPGSRRAPPRRRARGGRAEGARDQRGVRDARAGAQFLSARAAGRRLSHTSDRNARSWRPSVRGLPSTFRTRTSMVLFSTSISGQGGGEAGASG